MQFYNPPPHPASSRTPECAMHLFIHKRDGGQLSRQTRQWQRLQSIRGHHNWPTAPCTSPSATTMMACTHQAPSSSPQLSWRERATSPPRAPPGWSCTWLRPRGTLSQRNFVELAQRGFCDRSRRRQRQRDYRHAHRTTLYCWHTTHNSNVVAYIRVFILNCMHHH